MKKIVVLISGDGTNLQALIDACKSGRISAEIAGVISNKADAYGLQRAERAGISGKIFERQSFADDTTMALAIADYIQSLGADLIVLAGYMKILGNEFIRRFNGKILNIHPSLLPKYPGLNTYRRAIDAGETEHGDTVHFVNEEVDGGAVVLQAKVPIFPDDAAEDVEQRTREQEIRMYPLAVKWFVQDRLKLLDGKAYLDNRPLPPQGYAADE